MKTLRFFAFAFAVSALTACGGGQETADSGSEQAPVEAAQPEAEAPSAEAATGQTTYTVDNAQSELHWVGKKVGGQHEGNIAFQLGEFHFADGNLTGGVLEFDMASITVTDLEGEKKADLEGHLKNEDFFDTEQFPNGSYTIETVTDRGNFVEGGRVWQTAGKLTLKGITQEGVSVTAVVTEEGDDIRIKGETTFDRTAFGITYKSKSVLGDVADKFIEDDVTLLFNLVAKSGKVGS